MPSFINFQDDSTYPGQKFRRMVGRQQDLAQGFDDPNSFKVKVSTDIPGKLEASPGIAWIKDELGGVYFVERERDPLYVNTVGTAGTIILRVKDLKLFDGENALVLEAVPTGTAIPVRSLRLATYTGSNADAVVTDVRLTTTGQFIVSRSGPSNYGAPNTGTMGLALFSPGTQYTDLTTGIRYVKATDGTWTRDKGDVGTEVYTGSVNPTTALGKDKDFYIRSDTGDMWKRSPTSWGSSLGSLKGPKGDQGIQGIQGPKGDPGTGSGTVTAINSVAPNGAGNVTLTAANIGAASSTGGVSSGFFGIDGASGTYRSLVMRSAGVDRWQIQNDGVVEGGSNAGSNLRFDARADDGTDLGVALYLRRSDKRAGVGTVTLHGDATLTSQGAVAARDQAADPATATGGAYFYSKGGKAFVKQGDGTVFQVGAAASSSKSTTITTPAVGSYIIWQAPTDCTVTAVRGVRVGGTAATINASVNALDLLPLDLSLTTAGSWLAGPNLQNFNVKAGDSLTVQVRSVSGSPSALTVQIDVKGV
jgi:hypothetical protein